MIPISGDKIVKGLIKLGWSIRNKGNHTVLSKNGDHISVPMHKEVAFGTLKCITRKIGLDNKEFYRIIK
jgi:predicted RNA binding protein YcfA (HicA-like mRNA interferase family)